MVGLDNGGNSSPITGQNVVYGKVSFIFKSILVKIIKYSCSRIYQYNEDDILFQFPIFKTAETLKHLQRKIF